LKAGVVKFSNMKKIIFRIITIIFSGVIIFISCKKEPSCEGCKENNKPPTAIAGPDQVITLPIDSVLLDGSSSSDPDGTISEWLWKKISGPATLDISCSTLVRTIVRTLLVGNYQWSFKTFQL